MYMIRRASEKTLTQLRKADDCDISPRIKISDKVASKTKPGASENLYQIFELLEELSEENVQEIILR